MREETYCPTCHDGGDILCTACESEEKDRQLVELNDQLVQAEETIEKYKRWHREESDKASEYRKYKITFETLVDELKK